MPDSAIKTLPKLYWPVRLADGAFIGQTFGAHPEVYAQFGLKGHNGTDFVVKTGSPVYASCDGSLLLRKDLDAQGQYQGFGNYATITNPDGSTYYAHLEKFESGNREVKAGDKIGYADSTGFSTGSHVHFGFRPINADMNNGYQGTVDPQLYLAAENDLPNMTKYFKVNDHGKLGAMVLEGRVGIIIYEDNFPEYLAQLQILNKITDQTPTINIP